MTDKKTEALKLALEALTHGGCPPDCKDGMTDSGGAYPWGEAALIPCPNCRTIDFIREALAEQPAQQEQGDSKCQDDDGCPTETAVLQRFWRGQPIPTEHYPAWFKPAQQQEPVTVLPDGSAFAVMSYPLPKDHWLYADRQYNDGADEPVELGRPILTHEMRDAVVSAVRYAIRGATNCGKEVDFDPDALVQNAVYALCGPFTSPKPAQQQKEGFASPGGGYVPAIPRPMPLDWKLVPRKATPEMLKAMDECAQEGYDERLYAGMASSVYMAAWDASPVMGTLPEQPAQQQDYWQEEARRYAQNAEFWRGKYEAATAQQQEPVAWMLEWTFNGEERGYRLYDDERHCIFDAESDGGVCRPLYTAPPAQGDKK